MLGLGREIYHIKALLVVIGTTLRNFEKKFSVLRETGVKFLIFGQF